MASKAVLELVVALRDEASGALESLTKKLGIAGKAGLALGGIAGTLGGLGKMALDVGVAFDDTMDSIAVATGATGEQFESLQQIVKALFGSLPVKINDVADVMSVLGTRVQGTQEQIAGLGKSLLELSRLTGTGAAENAKLFTRVMGDWGISLDQASLHLDKLLVASQKGQINLDKLMSSIVRFGAPLRQMNFSFEESAALLAKWEREGVNSEAVLGALRIAIKNLSENMGEGTNSTLSLRDAFNQAVQRIRDARTEAEALTIGMAVFGSRAGPDMVAAIRENRFAVDDLVQSLQSADGALAGLSERTADYPEKLQILKNQLWLLIEPIGTELLGALTDVVDAIAPTLSRAMSAFAQWLSGPGRAALQEGLSWIEENLPRAFDWLTSQLPLVIQWMKENIPKGWAWLQENLPRIQSSLESFGYAVETVRGWIEYLNNVTLPAIREGLETLRGTWNNIRKAVDDFWKSVSDLLATLRDLYQKLAGSWPNPAIPLGGIFSLIQTVNEAINAVRNLRDELESVRAIEGGGSGGGGSRFGGGNSPQGRQSGTLYHSGGSVLGGEQGPELVELPAGAVIRSAFQTVEKLRNRSAGAATVVVNNRWESVFIHDQAAVSLFLEERRREWVGRVLHAV